jgi:hypothetical protein
MPRLSDRQRQRNLDNVRLVRSLLHSKKQGQGTDDKGQHQTRPAGESLDQAKEPDTDQG